jgi:hypothetical protein
MKNVYSMVLFLAICLGAAAQTNPEKATIIIKTSGNEQFEVKIAEVEPIQRNGEFIFQNLNEGMHLVTLHKIVSDGYNQPIKKQMVYRGNLNATKGMMTTYHLNGNVMRTGEKLAIAPKNGSNPANQHGNHYNNGNHYGWNGPFPLNYNHQNYSNCGNSNQYNHSCNSGCAPVQCHNNCGCNQPRPPHQCNHQCVSGHHFYGNVGYNYGQNGYNTNCSNGYNTWNFGTGYSQNYGYNNFGSNNNWNNGFLPFPSNPPQYNQNYDQNWNNYGNRQTINANEFSQLMSQIQDEFTDASKMQLIKLAVDQRAVTVDQVKAMMKEVTFESSKLEAAKYLYPRTVNQQQFYLVNDVFTFDSSKQELSEFILQ